MWNHKRLKALFVQSRELFQIGGFLHWSVIAVLETLLLLNGIAIQ